MPEATTRHPFPRPAFAAAFSLALVLAVGASTLRAQPEGGAVMPVFDADGRLEVPAGYERWVFAGASLGLSYSEGSGGMEMFHETLIEPTAYEHFERTGSFREGTMLALLLHSEETSVLPQRRGRFAGPVMAVEIAVKSDRFADGWGYFGFNPRRIRPAEAFGRESCASCHAEHARHDNVFLQFYPLLASAAPAGSPAAMAMVAAAEGGAADQAAEEAAEESVSDAALALRGLDPVMLIQGREDDGKPEIVMVHDGFEYRFVSEPNRKAFAEDPGRYTFQTDSCPVVPGAPIDGSLFLVHEGRLYGFASSACIDDFRADPGAYIDREDDGGRMEGTG